MRRYSVRVYAICRNELKFAARFMQGAREADEVIVLDTGSTDGTDRELERLGARVHRAIIDPWRFDVARNRSLDYVPDGTDICVCIDLDEVLTPGWRAALERVWTADATRCTYLYTWSWNADGSPGMTFWNEKIHARAGFRWIHPVHEVLSFSGPSPEVWVRSEKFQVHHFPDPSKPRTNCLALLELAVQESPETPRNAHYLGREYHFYGQYQKAIAELRRHLSLPAASWAPERAASMRLIAQGYAALGDGREALRWSFDATLECPGIRETWYELLKHAYAANNWPLAAFAADRALEIRDRPSLYLNEPEAWGWHCHDYASIAYWNVARRADALAQVTEAHRLNPGDTRIEANLRLMASPP